MFTFEPTEDTRFESVSKADLATLVPDSTLIYRVTDDNSMAVYDAEKGYHRRLVPSIPVSPVFSSDEIIDFRTMPDLTQLGIEATGTHSVTPSAINGQVSATLDAVDGLKFTEIKSSAWNHVLGMRAIGDKVESGKELSFIMRCGADCYVMAGLYGLHREVDERAIYQAYSDLEPTIYYNASAAGRLYRVYLGKDDSGYAVTSLAFKNPANATAYLDGMNDKWWRGTISAMGIEGSTSTVVEIDPSLAATSEDLFGASVEVGAKLTSVMPINRGSTSEYSSFGFALNRANNGMDLMAVKLA